MPTQHIKSVLGMFLN